MNEQKKISINARLRSSLFLLIYFVLLLFLYIKDVNAYGINHSWESFLLQLVIIGLFFILASRFLKKIVIIGDELRFQFATLKYRKPIKIKDIREIYFYRREEPDVNRLLEIKYAQDSLHWRVTRSNVDVFDFWQLNRLFNYLYQFNPGINFGESAYEILKGDKKSYFKRKTKYYLEIVIGTIVIFLVIFAVFYLINRFFRT